MKRKISLILVISIIILGIAGCGNQKEETNVESSSGVMETNNDYMEKYIAKLESSQDRTNFLNFWNAMCSYCSGLEYELVEMGNKNTYEFDPTEPSDIPVELSEKYDFASIKFFDGFKTHTNFKMKVDGENVTLSFDGEEFYPTNYGYSEVQNIVNKYNAE